MKFGIKLITGISVITLAACSTQPVKLNTSNQSQATEPVPQSAGALSSSGINPPLKVKKDNKILNLVRIMDGGACKNNNQGAKGEFLIYADLNDIERIKREKTPEIFKDFEDKIQAFSSQVLQVAVEATNLSEDPFSLGEDEAQQKLASQLANNFRNAAKAAVNAFQRETTLTIDVTPFSPSFVFYQKGCDMTLINQAS